MGRTEAAVKSFLPRGGSLPPDQWRRRHSVVVWILWAHAVGLTIFGIARGLPLYHAASEGAIVARPPFLAQRKELSPKWRSAVAAFGLVAASGIFVHMSGGVIEVHFHFFV